MKRGAAGRFHWLVDRLLARELQDGRGIVKASAETRVALANAVRSGQLLRLYPEIYVDSGLMRRLSGHGQYQLRCRAALQYVRGSGAISHVSALSVWDLLPAQGKIHITVDRATRQRSTNGLAVHHHEGFAQVKRFRRAGVTVTSAADALVTSWPMLMPDSRIGCVVRAIEARTASASQIREALARLPKLRGRKALVTLLNQVDSGCRSPLEIWGAQHVFTGREFAGLKRQFPVRIAGQLFLLDLFAEAEKVNFELDGTAFHGNTIQRERDLKRDALLATLGIVVVRYSYARLMSEPDAVRLEARAILTSRRVRS